MKNTISARVGDFLKQFPPFNEMCTEDLHNLSQEVHIIYKIKDSIIFEEEAEPHDYFYVVHRGAVVLKKKSGNDIVDLCDEGDIFGLRPLMASENYKLQAKAFEESILYAIPIAIFKPYTQKYEGVANFLIESFASNTRNPYSKIYRGKLLGESLITPTQTSEGLLDLQHVHYSKKPVTSTEDTSIKKIAQTMTQKKVGAMLIVRNKLPVGIITDKDIRNKIASGEFPITAKAKSIMSSPVITYPQKMTIAQAQMAMMKSGISHLCLTKDGTQNTPAIGILSKHDVMLELGNNPSVLMKAIQRANKFKGIKTIRRQVTSLLKGYLNQNIPMTLTSSIISELTHACTKRVIEIVIENTQNSPPVKFAWLAMGSQGRSEQLLQTDQDNALVFDTVPENELQQTRTYFLELAKKVNQALRTIGYEYCPAEMMASNKEWCLSLSE